MRIALIGIDDLFPALVRAIAASHEHQLVAVCDADESTTALQGLCPETNWDRNAWESWMVGREVDVVIFAHSNEPDRSEEQLKRLAQSGVPLLVMHPACDVMQAYEIELIRREVGGIVLPYAPAWWHPAWLRLREFFLNNSANDNALNVEQVIWERFLPDCSSSAVWRQFCRDEPMLREWLQKIGSVSAIGMSPDETSLSHLNIHCAGTEGTMARWTVAPLAGEHASQLTFVGSDGTVSLQIPGGYGIWTIQRQGHPERESFISWDDVQQLLTQLPRALVNPPSGPTWSDVCMGLETVDAAQKSLRRKRAIDLNAGERSEEYTFKGLMSAMGCLALVMVVAGFLVLAVVEGFRMPLRDSTLTHNDEPVTRWPLWARLWPVYPLIAFLLLQFLLQVTRANNESGAAPAKGQKS